MVLVIFCLHRPIPELHPFPATNPTAKHIHESKTLTRLGTGLNFHADRCPSGSLESNPVEPNVQTESNNDCPAMFIIGARKGGTTSLYHYLSKHPDFTGINLNKGPQAGETFFFQRGDYKQRLANYVKMFPSNGTMSGDSSVGNLVHCKAPRRILSSCGNKVKIIILLRNPTNRLVSNFLMRVRLRTRSYANSQQVISQEIQGFSTKVMNLGVSDSNYTEHWDKLLCMYGPAQNMVFEGIYYTHVMNWLCTVPLENVLIVNSEEFFVYPARILGQVLEFLKLSELDEATLHSITSAVYNEGSYDVRSSLKVSDSGRERLDQLYEGYNKPLLELLSWKDKLTW